MCSDYVWIQVVMTIFEFAMCMATQFGLSQLIILEDYCDEHPKFRYGTTVLKICEFSLKPVVAVLVVATWYWAALVIMHLFRGARWCFRRVRAMFTRAHQD